MRRPFRKAALWWLAACLGAALAAAATVLHDGADDYVALGIGLIGVTLIPFGLVFGLMSMLAALGEHRLRRGVGVIARWQLAPAAWEAFRAFDARHSAEPAQAPSDTVPRPATGPVEVLFGRRQVIVDGSYHPIRRWAIPELSHVGWLAPPDAPECLEFGLIYPRGRYGGTIRTALRVPVPPAAREDGIRVFHHFRALAPKPRVGLAERRPGLVIGCGAGVTALSLMVFGAGWLMHRAGDNSALVLVLMIAGMMFAIGGAVFTLIVVLVALAGRKRG
jgi:hypothetical protein